MNILPLCWLTNLPSHKPIPIKYLLRITATTAQLVPKESFQGGSHECRSSFDHSPTHHVAILFQLDWTNQFELSEYGWGLTLIGGNIWFSISSEEWRTILVLTFYCHETDQWKIQTNHEILACEIPAVKRTGTVEFILVGVPGIELRLVVTPGTLMHENRIRS